MSDSRSSIVLKLIHGEYETLSTKKYEARKSYVPNNPALVIAHIPGVICSVSVEEGTFVEKGDPLLVLEAMKMQNDITAPLRGRVKAVYVQAGDTVPKNHILVDLEPE